MAEDCSWTWMESALRKIPVPVPVISLLIGTMILLLYWLFSRYVVFFEWNKMHQLSSVAVSTLIAYQIAGVFYLMVYMKKNFRLLDLFYASSEFSFCKILEDKFRTSYLYYLLIVYIIAPIFLINGLSTQYFCDERGSNLGRLLDVYNDILIFIVLFLLATILWIILNMAWSLREAGKKLERSSVTRDVLNSDLKLKSLKSFILKVLIYYFICISLAITTYYTPIGLSVYETIFFIILLMIGAAFFFAGLDAIQAMISSQIEKELEPINMRIMEQIQRVEALASQKDYISKGEEINSITSMLEIMQKQRAELLSIRIYDLRSIGTFITATILPIMALINGIPWKEIMNSKP
ncbi:MAG: hypothetical protein WCP70_05230 [Methanothrix sp.]